ncbi:hypothetical protein IWQ51_000362 [Labrenzia sp. EL_142]|nr:hypothetical protein [Labrenzia sp. EL_142]
MKFLMRMVVVLASFFPIAQGANAITMTADVNNLLTVKFSVPVLTSAYNEIGFGLGTTISRLGFGGLSSLYVGKDLIGVHNAPNGIYSRFVGSDNIYAHQPLFAAVIDFARIAKGTTSGVYTYQITSASTPGAFLSFKASEFEVKAAVQSYYYYPGYSPRYMKLVVDEITVSTVPVSTVPLPASLPLLAGGVMLMGIVRRRTRQN